MEYYNLTIPQKNIDKLQTFYSETEISRICGALLFEEKYNKKLLNSAVNYVLKLYDGLRLRFCRDGAETFQYIQEYTYEETECKEFADFEELKNFSRELIKSKKESSYQFVIFEIKEKSGIILCADHRVSDAWTYSILAETIYKFINGTESKSFSYLDYISNEEKYFQSEQFERDKNYWSQKYNSVPEISKIKNIYQTADSPEAARYSFKISETKSRLIKNFCADNDFSAAVFFEAAVMLYLSAINFENSDITIGMPVLGRSSAAEKKTAGMFVATLPLTVNISAGDTVKSVCAKITEAHREVYRHRKYPYEYILRDIREKNELKTGLYDVMVSFQNAMTNIPAKTEWFSNGYCEVPFLFHIDDRDGSECFNINIDYQTGIFENSDEIVLISERLLFIFEQMLSDADILQKDISVLPDREFNKLIFEYNKTETAYNSEKCIHEVFSEKLSEFADKTALVFEGQKYSYRQLDSMSDEIAYFLRQRGVGRNDIIPVISRRNPDIIIAILGVLKAGAAYMPVSPDYPEERIQYMTKNANAKLILTSGCNYDFIENIPLDEYRYTEDSVGLNNINQPDDAAYVIFTSGSTGKPKGIVITHKNVINYCSKNKFNVCGKIADEKINRIISVTNFIFDIFVTESIMALLNGMEIYLTNDDEAVSQKNIDRLICENKIDIIQTTPSKMRSYILDKTALKYLSVLKTIVLGGEEFPPELCRELKKYTSANIYNIYGPAETTVWVTSCIADSEDMKLGNPFANTHIYILDKNSRPVPAGISGELCIAGDCVGKGYLNNDELTRQKFLPNPFVQGEMMYRTGDLAVIRADGGLKFLGRSDTQIKIHGLRVEAGDIESAMSGYNGIGLTAVICSNEKLIGYYVSENEIDERAFREYLLKSLPAYMIPHYFIRLEKMPMTPSGKTDRKNLPLPDISKRHSVYKAPENETEKILCSIISDILKTDKTGTDDDFFELGGDSFAVIELVSAAEQRGIYFTVRDFYENSTVAAISAHISEINHKEENDENVLEYPLKRSKTDFMIFRIFSVFTKLFYRLEITGLERLKPGKRYIICPNHESDLDCMWVWHAVNKIIDINETCALIAAEHLKNKLSRLFFKIAGGIPVDRKGDFSAALQRAEMVLKNEKKYILIHPEGTRTRDGKLGKFKKGAAMLSVKSGADIIPVCINGAGEIYPVYRKYPYLFNFSALKRYTLNINFGEPISPMGKTIDEITDEMYRQILKIKNGEML